MTTKTVRIFFLLTLLLSAIPEYCGASVILDEEELIFRLEAPGAERVFLVGDFNEWNPTVDRMVRRGDLFEIRLFLVTGKYRYMFIVDGKAVDDADSPAHDAEGRAYFFFRETGDRYEIVYSNLDGDGPGPVRQRLGFSQEGYLGIGEEFRSGQLSFSFGYSEENGMDAEVVPVFRYDYEDQDRLDSYLLRSRASYRTDRGGICAFNRYPLLGYGDPLSLFGKTGPFSYPAGLFRRGVAVEGSGFGIDGEAVYAGRIEGYDPVGAASPPAFPIASSGSDALPFDHRSPVDSDAISLRIGSRIGRHEFDYLFRHDIGPNDRYWIGPEDQGSVYCGFEKMSIHGFWGRFETDHDLDIEIQYLNGSTELVSATRCDIDGAGTEEYIYSEDWEKGSKACVFLRYGKEKIAARLLFASTYISGDALLRGGRSSDSRRTFRAEIELNRGAFDLSVECLADLFSDGSEARHFWDQKWNFWLDGDDITLRRLPFIFSRGVYEAGITVTQIDSDSSIVPYRTGGRISMNFCGDIYRDGLRVTELLVSKGHLFKEDFSFHLDARMVFYGDDRSVGYRRFTDLWAGVCWRPVGSGWIALGSGISPLFFDRWSNSLIPFGRERYIADRGVFQTDMYPDEAGLLEDLYDAEQRIEDEWSITFEAGVSF